MRQVPPVAKTSPWARGSTNLASVRRERARAAQAQVPETPFMEWAQRVPEPKTGQLDFDRFPFQVELYSAPWDEPETIVKKATQIGISALLVRWTLGIADVKGWTVLYVFPKQNLMWDFADARVKPLIIGSKYLRARVPRAHTQNKGLRQIGRGFVYYRGSESEAALESIDADALALDEYDSLEESNIPIAERRLSGSPYGLIRRVGVPSVPGFGLDALYEKSDQRNWHVQCGRCKKWQPIFFHRGARSDDFEVTGYVDQERKLVVCGHCHKPLDVAKGEWVARFYERTVRGYHASRLIVPAVARNDRNMLGGIIEASLSPEPLIVQIHNNRDLGEAYATKEGRLSLDVLKAAQREYAMVEGYQGDRLITMGVDVASVRALNVRISEHTAVGQKRALWIGQAESFDKVQELIEAFGVNMFAVDHLPEGRLARDLCARYPGRGYMVALTGAGAKNVFSVDEPNSHVSVRRTEALDAMMLGIRSQRNLLPANPPEGYAKQMQAPVRFLDQDEFGKVVVGYRSSGADDYAMAEVFDVVATDLWSYRQNLESMEQGEIVALEDRLEFQRSHLNAGEADAGMAYSPGGSGGYSAGFSAGEQEQGYDDPYSAWPNE